MLFTVADSHSASQENPCLACNPKIYYHIFAIRPYPDSDESSLHPHTLFS